MPDPRKLEKTGTPGIFRRGDRYVVIWRHRGRQHKSYHRTLAEAREAKGQRASGDRRPRSRVKFGDYFETWIESYAGRTARGFSETTRPEYRRPIETYALPRWRTWALDDVEPADVRELFAAARTRGTSTSGLKKLRAALSAMFATAVEDGAVRANAVHGVRIPTARADEELDHEEHAKALTRAELRLVLAGLPADWRLFFELLTHTGLRISEAIGLTWEHVELGPRPRILVREQFYRGKRRKLKSRHGRRDVPLSSGMAERLREVRRDTYRGDKAPVFPSATGTVLHPSNVARRVLKPVAKAAGLTVAVAGKDEPIPWVSFHTFRHTCASLLFDAGKNVKQVQEWLGHADPGFTLRTYVHLMDGGLGDADFLDSEIRANYGFASSTITAGSSS